MDLPLCLLQAPFPMPVGGSRSQPWDGHLALLQSSGIIPLAARNAAIRWHLAKVSRLAQGQTCLPGQPLSNDWSYKVCKCSLLLPHPGTTLQGHLSLELPTGAAEVMAETALWSNFPITVLHANFHHTSASQGLPHVTNSV